MNENERDPRLDAAWSAASREQPPPALDAAIRAAARRAADSGPRGKRSKHWWYPVAAAATVALFAVGIAQLTPPERVAPAAVSDTAPAPGELRQDSVAPAAEAASAPSAAPSPPPMQRRYAPEEPAPATAAKVTGEHSRPAPAMAGKKTAGASDAKRRPPEGPAPQDRAAAEAAGAGQGAPSALRAPAAPPSSNPFPAAAPAAQSGRDENLGTGSLNATAPPAAAPAAPMASRAAVARAAPASDALTQTAAERRVEEWIKRIRDLKNAGRQDDAAKELAAFRSAYGAQADALLPADLRSSKP